MTEEEFRKRERVAMIFVEIVVGIGGLIIAYFLFFT